MKDYLCSCLIFSTSLSNRLAFWFTSSLDPLETTAPSLLWVYIIVAKHQA